MIRGHPSQIHVIVIFYQHKCFKTRILEVLKSTYGVKLTHLKRIGAETK